MKFVLDNVGAIKHATLQLAPLTIVCGKNNSGKTYLTTAISEFLAGLRGACRVESMETVSGEEERASIDLIRYVDPIRQKVKAVEESFKTRNDILHGGTLSVELDDADIRVDRPAIPSTWTSNTSKHSYSVVKTGSVLEISRRIEMKVGDAQDVEDCRKQWGMACDVIVNAYLFRQKYGCCLPGDVVSVGSERMGVVYFKDALDIAMRRKVQTDDSSAIGEGHLIDSEQPEGRAESMFPKAIVRTLDFISWLGMRKKTGALRPAEFGTELQSDLEKLTEGSYSVEDQGMVFSPEGTHGLILNAKDASSSVRSLFLLDQYVRYAAERGDVLFIDEPETNLHPQKQRQLARFVAKLVNKGINVFVTTHSDYFIREINVLLMLAEDDARLRSIADRYEYAQDELLRVEKVRPYRVEGGELHDMPMSQECGIEVSAFDDVIRDLNHIQNEILHGAS